MKISIELETTSEATSDDQNEVRYGLGGPDNLTDETVAGLHRLGEILRRIHQRVASEESVIRDGHIINGNIIPGPKHITEDDRER